MKQALSAKMVETAHVRRRFGYRRIHDLLRPRIRRREPQEGAASVLAGEPVGAQVQEGQAPGLRTRATAAGRRCQRGLMHGSGDVGSRPTPADSQHTHVKREFIDKSPPRP